MEGLVARTLFVGQSAKWFLPEIVQGDYPFDQVVVLPEKSLTPYIYYDDFESSINYNGDSSSEKLIGDFLQLFVKLVDVNNFSKVYTVQIEIRMQQGVVVIPENQNEIEELE